MTGPGALDGTRSVAYKCPVPSVTHVRVRYKDTDTMSVEGAPHEWRFDATLRATSHRADRFQCWSVSETLPHFLDGYPILRAT